MPPSVEAEIVEEEGMPMLYEGPGEKLRRAEVWPTIIHSNCQRFAFALQSHQKVRWTMHT